MSVRPFVGLFIGLPSTTITLQIIINHRTHSYFVITGSTLSHSIRLPSFALSVRFSILRGILIFGRRPLATLPLCMPQYFIVFDSSLALPWTWELIDFGQAKPDCVRRVGLQFSLILYHILFVSQSRIDPFSTQYTLLTIIFPSHPLASPTIIPGPFQYLIRRIIVTSRKSRTREIKCWNAHITLQFGRLLDSMC